MRTYESGSCGMDNSRYSKRRKLPSAARAPRTSGVGDVPATKGPPGMVSAGREDAGAAAGGASSALKAAVHAMPSGRSAGDGCRGSPGNSCGCSSAASSECGSLRCGCCASGRNASSRSRAASPPWPASDVATLVSPLLAPAPLTPPATLLRPVASACSSCHPSGAWSRDSSTKLGSVDPSAASEPALTLTRDSDSDTRNGGREVAMSSGSRPTAQTHACIAAAAASAAAAAASSALANLRCASAAASASVPTAEPGSGS
mmetsp:Transcript_3224/g.8950  ORF Transcript_3224/g.8950 Transcript_3224/m.8950 type:complete len:260 (-) Transcript_3224:1958-2737(-)|eukprot:363437-Chlamydomonas_euryale.AAC.13